MENENIKTLTVKDKLDKLDKFLDEYLQNKGIYVGPIKNQTDYERLMTLSYDEIKKLSDDDRQAMATTLAQFSFFLERDYNREQARLSWANSQIDKTIAKLTGQQDRFHPYEERKNDTISENEVAYKLNEIRIHAQARVDVLKGLSYKIRELVQTLKKDRQWNQ